MFEQRKHIVKKRKFFKLSNFVKINKKNWQFLSRKLLNER